MNKYQEIIEYFGVRVINVLPPRNRKELSKANAILILELVDKATILQDENVQKLLKTFIPINEPYCSNCMFYTESNCDKKDNCYLNKFIKAIDWSNDD